MRHCALVQLGGVSASLSSEDIEAFTPDGLQQVTPSDVSSGVLGAVGVMNHSGVVHWALAVTSRCALFQVRFYFSSPKIIPPKHCTTRDIDCQLRSHIRVVYQMGGHVQLFSFDACNYSAICTCSMVSGYLR